VFDGSAQQAREVTVSQQDSGQDGKPSRTFVEIRLPAELTQLPIVRSVAATIAIREDFDLDEIEDMKLAVDEMCSTLIARAMADAVLTCRFEVTDGDIQLLAAAPSGRGEPVDERSFGWQVLTTLADTVATRITPDGTGYLVDIEISKTRGTAYPR
jgi:serine/threonine-protein kinase RsbW